MTFWSRLFGRKESRESAAPARDVEALAASLMAPAIHALKSTQQTSSHMGGRPFAPADFVWPTRNGTPLGFLAQIDLRQLQQCQPIAWLPVSGVLLFFYDITEQPWGIAPDDRHGWRVIHTDADPAPLPEIAFPSGLTGGDRLPKQWLTFRPIRSWPSSDRNETTVLGLSDAESNAYIDLRLQQYDGKPQHQLTGYASEIQSDEMAFEAQFLSNGVNLSEVRAQPDGRTEALEAGVAEWRLLFQVDSDETCETMWGDAGMLYFWIRESDARARRFDRAWLILQCY